VADPAATPAAQDPPDRVARILAILDRLGPRRKLTAREVFQVRFVVGGAMLGIGVAAISAVAAMLSDQLIELAFIGGFAVGSVSLIAAARAGARIAGISWAAVLLVATFLVLDSLLSAALLPEQLPWLVLLPLVSLVLLGPRDTAAAEDRSRRPVALSAALAIALGACIVIAQSRGLNFGQQTAPSTAAEHLANFVPFVISVGGMMWLYDLALRGAERELRQLRRLLSVCAWCKQIRDDAEGWISLERYIAKRDTPHLSHGICPSCVAVQFPEDAAP
jgi:hypothetical protein